ncbi:MAG: hypothetical protein ABIQ64_00970 [Candidatus Saccharimonadales bacterium]
MNTAFQMLAEIKITADELKIPKVVADGDQFDRILGLIYVFIAAISLFYVVRGALLYVTHGGEANTAKEARETVLYAVVALIGSSLVFALLQFVLNQVKGP